MCGIIGTYNHKIKKELFNECSKRLSHRGPDGDGYWEDSLVQLGHRRLSIIDLSSNGSQPMLYDNGRYVISYNGEIYNYLELKKELQKLRCSFVSESDTEVIVAAYKMWGPSCLLKFNGMFAIAIWDSIKKELFLARDRFGVKPLYYYKKENEFAIAFASEMKALVPMIDNPSFCKQLLHNKDSMLSYEGTDKCLVNEISRFPAASYALINEKGMSLTQWWNTMDHLIDVPKDYNEQVELFRDLFVSACKLRMRSDVNIGTALSGGIDSSAVISTMAYVAKHETCTSAPQWQNAYVATFGDSPIDERKYAKKVVDHLGISSNYITISPDKFWINMSDDLYWFEDVYLTPPYPMMMLYSEMRKNNTLVTIDGHGADELFCGYDMAIPRAFLDAGFNLYKAREVANTYLDIFSEDGQNLVNLQPKWFKLYVDHMIFHLANAIKGRGTSCKVFGKKVGYLNALLYEESHTTVLPTLLRNYDRYSMRSGVEIRMPFLDHRIVEFAFSIGWQSKIRNGYTKSIIRDAMNGIMPTEIIQRKPKVGFSSPLLEWFRGPLRDDINDLLTTQEFVQSDLIDVAKARILSKKVQEDPNATQLDAEDLWMAIQPYFWEKFFWERAKSI